MHAPPGEPRRASLALRQAAAPQAKAGHPGAGIAAPRQARARPDSPPRARPGDADGRGARGSRAWSDRRAPSGGDDAPTEADAAAGEAATAVPMVERSPQSGGNRPGPGTDLQQAPIVVVTHHHPARVAREALGRVRGNARAVLEHGLPRRIRIGQHLGIDVDHHLVTLARGAGIEVVKGRLREQGQGIGLLLGQRGRFL